MPQKQLVVLSFEISPLIRKQQLIKSLTLQMCFFNYFVDIVNGQSW